MKIELSYTTWEGCWQECALCGEGFRPYEVEAHTKLPGEYCEVSMCKKGIEVPTLGELYNLERRRGGTVPLDLLDFDEC